MKPHSVRITTPKAGHHVELLSHQPLPFVVRDGLSGYFGFSEFHLVRGEKVLRCLVDQQIPVEFKHPDFGWQDAAMVGFHLPNPTALDKKSFVEFKVHLTSPVIPRTRGLWLRLVITYDPQDGLVFKHTIGRSSEAWVYDGTQWTVAAKELPDWLLGDSKQAWVVETGRNVNGVKRRSLSAGNTLLCASWQDARPLLGNLLHFDDKLIGDQEGDYRFSLQPVARGNGRWDLCTELLAAEGFGAPAPVSHYALQLAHEHRTVAALGARGGRWVCEPEEDAKGLPSGWTLRWLGVPGQPGAAPRHTFTLESFTEAHLGAHAFGLATTRSRNRLSIVPTRVSTVETGAGCDLTFDLARQDFDVADVRLRSVRFATPTALRLFCGGAQGTSGGAWEIVALASDHGGVAPAAPLLLHWDLAPLGGHPNTHQLGAGSVLLTIDGFEKGEISMSCSGNGSLYRRSPPEADLRLEFSAVRYGPLSMDPEIGFETLSALVDRPRPWTFDILPGTACPGTFWEKASDEQSRLLRIELVAPDQGEITTDVVLLDPSPMTFVRVRSTETAEGGDIVAEYVDDSDQAPEWRFFSKSGEMTAVLPPQGIGEEMVKGYLFLDDDGYRTPVPLPGRLFDFRLTPVARLVLDRTDIDTARSEAPWSLRRLLSQRPGTTGMKLERARFELLYGLQAEVDVPGLRIAELDGLVGRVPFSDSLQRAFVRQRQGRDTPQGRYAEDVARWQAGLWHRPSWWRVYRDRTQRQTLALQEGVKYALRPTRSTANPFEIGTHATDKGKQADARWSRRPLRGGVDWPFQSRNVYAELLGKPDSSSGSIEGLAFGTLGGEGAQTAAFNNGKTLVISTSRQGRLDSLTLIRVGRIAMTWNKARHVIVYERTTRRAPRYDIVGPDPANDDLEVQPKLEGMAALRKVREYVEITEPRRRYPDSKTERPVSGPLVQSVFGTTVVPVMSSWGRDVPGGFAIALRGPIPPGKEKFFPDPQVFLDFARPVAKGAGAVSQRVTSTDRLVFFSSTRPEDGGDTDKWPAWPDIDFPSIRPPAPPSLPFSSSFAGLRQPDAPAAELGMTPFTLQLSPAEEAVNLMHGRNVPGLEARLSNINLARGLPVLPALKGDALKALEATGQFGSQRAMLLDGLGELRLAARQLAALDSTLPVSQNGQLRKDLGQLLATLKAQVPQPLPDVPSMDLTQVQAKRAAAYLEGLEQEGLQLAQQVLQFAARAAQGAASDLVPLRQQAIALVDAVNLQAKERLGNLPVVRLEALEHGRAFLDGLTSRLGAHLSTALSLVTQAIAVFQARLSAQPDQLSCFEAEWRERIARLPGTLRGIVGSLAPALEGGVGQWFSQVGEADTLVARVRLPVDAALSGLADYLDRWLAALPPFDVEMPDLAVVETELRALLDPRLASELLKSLVGEFKDLLGQLGSWDQTLQDKRRELDQAIHALQSALTAAADPTQLAATLAGYAQGLELGLKQMAREIAAVPVPPSVEAGMAALQGSFDALRDGPAKVRSAVDAISTEVDKTVGELERVVQAQVAIAEAQIAAGSRQLEEWARAQIAPALEIGSRNVDAALETLRILAEGPVTQGLLATRDQLGYYYDKARDALAVTPTSAIFNDLGAQALNALSARIPFNAIQERLLPMIGGLAVRDLFPDFCGLKLTDLLPDLDVPLDGTHQFDWLTIQHGFDPERVSAWAKVTINKRFDTDATLFDLGPVKLRLLKPLFHAVADLTFEDDRLRQLTYGRLQADFELSLNGKPMVTLADGVLAFDERGKLDFQFDSEKLELAQELTFIQQALRALMPQVEGLTLTPLLPAGIEAQLCLPLPDIGTGAFTLTGITLNSNLGLRIGDGFEIRTGLWLSKPERPFGLAVLFLGGGGWFGIEAAYKPPSRFVTRVSIGISAGAFVALNFGFASGSAGLLFTAGVDFYRDWQSGSGTTAVSLGMLMWGEFSIMGIASAGVRLMMRITYDGQGGMRGEGTLSVSIKICWCYTLRVNRTVAKQFTGDSASGSRSATAASVTGPAAARTKALAPSAHPRPVSALAVADPLDYAKLPLPQPAVAVQRYFATLAI